MSVIKNLLIVTAFLLLAFTFAARAAEAKGGNEYKAIVKHLKTKYKAKKVKIPFLWLARFAVSVVRPAGVKSFSVTIFEDLKFSRETLDAEMQTVMRKSFSAEWIPILRVRAREGQQVYMYMREAGSSIRLTLVTIERQQAAVIRATFNPEKLADFINDPKVFGISLNENNRAENNTKEISNPKDEAAAEEKTKQPEKEN